jgi:hypothetical protein
MKGVHLLCLIVESVAFVSTIFTFFGGGHNMVDTTTFAADHDYWS